MNFASSRLLTVRQSSQIVKQIFASSSKTSSSVINNKASNNNKKSEIGGVGSESDLDWVRVYRFPYIVPLRSFSRFKIWQTLGTIGLCPFVVAAYQSGQLSTEFAVGSVVSATLATATLYAISYFTRNLVGIVAFNERDESIRIGRLTFWGRRVNDIFPRTDIVPIEDIGENPSDIWWRVYRYSKPKKPYFFVLKLGGVDRPDLFRSIFGTFRG